MKYVNIKESTDRPISLIPIGDVHYGSVDCNVEKFEKLVDWIKSKDHTRIALMGDLIDVGLKDSVGAGTFDNNKTPEEQIEYIVKILEPVKDKIWCMVTGNHEVRIQQRTSIDVSKLIANTLGIKYCGHSAFIKARINKENYTIFVTHGSSGAVTATGKLNAATKYNTYIDADLYLSGHTHELLHHTTSYYKISLKDKMIVKDKRHYVVTGHFLRYGGYAEAKGYIPGKSGVAKVVLRGDKKDIRVSI